MNPTLMVLHMFYSWHMRVIVETLNKKRYIGYLVPEAEGIYSVYCNKQLLVSLPATITIRPDALPIISLVQGGIGGP